MFVIQGPLGVKRVKIDGNVISACLQENWSAFAPDFKELDENVEYDERESEFDIEEEGKEKQDFKGKSYTNCAFHVLVQTNFGDIIFTFCRIKLKLTSIIGRL